MEHYFIILCKDISTLQESVVPHYITSLLPNIESLSHLSTRCLPIPLLQCNSAYISVVNSYVKEELLEWKEVKDFTSVRQIIAECLKTVQENSEAEDVSKVQNLSPLINHLADQLPSSGTFKLDVIVNYDVFKEFPVSCNIEFAGSLYRLIRWHGAHMVIAAPTEVDHSILKEWSEITGATLLENEIDPMLGTLIWQGSMQFQPASKSINNTTEFQLRLDYSENAVLLDNPVSKATNKDLIHSEHLILSPSIKVVDECNVKTIPPYMVLPFGFRLSTCQSKDKSKLVEYFNNKCDAALIARMNYSVTADKPKTDKSLSTNLWQKMVSTGYIKFPEDSLPTTDSYVSFIITKSRKTHNIIAYPMSNPHKLNTQFYFTYLNELNTRPNLTNGKVFEKANVELKLPYLTETGLHALVNKINTLKVGMSRKCEIDHSIDSEHICLQSVLESSTKDCGSCFLFLGGDNTSELLCEEVDPADWPERVCLLQKQMRLEKEKTSVQPLLLQNLSPQRNQINVCFTSEDAMKYFEPSGEAKNVVNAELISSLYNVKHLIKQDHNKVLQTEWPEVMKFTHDDIYYNSSAHAEELESMCNELVRFYVQHETSCSCNCEQLRPDPAIPIRVRQRESSQKWKSPAKLRTPKKLNQSLRNQVKPSQGGSTVVRQGSIGDAQSTRLMKKRGSFSSSIEKLAEIGRSRKHLVKANSLPVRQSPRKKMPLTHSSAPSSRQPQAALKKQSNSEKLPELSIKKLRVAVVQALEEHDINSKHSFFRPCFKRLFTICQAFAQDLPTKKGRTSEHLQKIADANVQQVIEFEKLKDA